MPMPTTVNGRPVKTGSWTPQEDKLLAEWQAKLGNRWSSVAKKIPGRTGQQCAQRWRHKVNPSIRKEKWTEEEDHMLVRLVRQFGNAWAEISRRLEGRTDQQCMGRWRRHLDPAIRRDSWCPKEDAALAALYHTHGSQWSAISKAITGRTAQQCRARWFQMEAGDEAGPRSGARPGARARPKRLEYVSEDDEEGARDSDGGEGEWGEEGEGYADSAGEGDGVQEAEEPDAFRTPVKRRHSRPGALRRPWSKDAVVTEEEAANVLEGLASRGAALSAAVSHALGERRESGHSTCTRSSSGGDVGAREAREMADTQRGDGSAHDGPEGEDAPPERGEWRGSEALGSPVFVSPARHRLSGAPEPELLGSCGRRGSGGQRFYQMASPPRSALRFKSPEGRRAAASPLGRRPRPHTADGLEPASEPGPRAPPASLFTPPAKAPPLAGGTPATAGRGGGGGGAGGGRAGHAAHWRMSPTVNILALLQSPQAAGAKADLPSPAGFKGLVTPEWAKRKWAAADAPASAPPLYQAPGDDLPTAGRPLNREGAPVNRRLNIDRAMRGGSSTSAGLPLRTVPQEGANGGRRALCSPAKKLKAEGVRDMDCDASEGPGANGPGSSGGTGQVTASSGDGSNGRSGALTCPPPFGLYHMRRCTSSETDEASELISARPATDTAIQPALPESCARAGVRLTNKENSACNALRQLSVAALDRSVSEALSAAAAAAAGAGRMQPDAAENDGSVPRGSGPEVATLRPSILSSRTSDVRMRLHALLEEL